MIVVSEYEGQNVAVFGLGKAGEATIASLLAGGAQIYAWDDHEASCERAVTNYGGKIHIHPVREWPWESIKVLVLSPGIPLTHPKPHMVVELANEHRRPIIGDIELLFRACPKAHYIGITGTNGKSTTTTLIGHILKTAGIKTEIGGNLGTAALALKQLEAGGVYVIETSSYQLDLLASVRFRVAAFMNMTPDHLDRHGDMEGYLKAKMHIFDRQGADDTAVIAVDDDYTKHIAAELKKHHAQKLVEVSASHKLPGIYVEDGILHDGKCAFDLTHIATLTGRHNWQNAAVAYGVARACGIGPDTIYDAMKTFGGLRHRLQLVATIRGVRFINDSKATNADATSNALAPYERIYWIAGGKAKEGGIEALAPYFGNIKHVFLMGAATEDFAQTLAKHNVPFTCCGTLDKAVEAAAKESSLESKPGAVVLLSPACASFDQWKNFEERGDAFCQMVEQFVAHDGDTKGERHAF
jgi:UDP-N-acetylmuramoylalanine--D-glutamate ligase